ncbi:CoA ester lyase [Deinococcus sp. NW-56]|uniref:HpcH/HpaI aldolase/citrate lyase family protein n=1 Tax=Deinococcus sp. NW-56 TaxID=2080419 RepID=UPI000CF46B44|nr:CoA ester lyase [Deinococcus sp. NW-56]
MSVRPLRSVLYVPGDKPRAIEKARTLGADAVILDLEDAVAPEHKDAARENVAAALRTPWQVPVLVRVNGLGTPWEYADRELALRAGADGLVLPKVEDAATVRDLHLRVPLWAMIETPRGVLHAAEIAAAPGVAGLIVGANDLARALRTRPDPSRTPLLHALSAVVLAARAHGKVPLDAVYNDVRDPQGFGRECEQGRTLGFSGKTVIHPGQVEIANRTFGVSEVEVAAARGLIAAWTQARNEGRSVATYQGALVEQMHVDEAQETLALWEATRTDQPLA